MPIPDALALSHLSYRFGHTEVLRDVTLALPAGRIYGLLGRNGAGKSTLIRLITSQLMPQTGDVRIFGRKPSLSPTALGDLCLIADTPDFGVQRTVRDVLRAGSLLFPRWSDAQAHALLARFELPEQKRVKGLSRGMQTALCLTCGLAANAPFTLFDEPSLGLDAVIRERFYDTVLESQAVNPRTILLSTHLIDEVARTLDHAIMLDAGKIILDSDLNTLRADHNADEPFSLQKLFVQLTEHIQPPLPSV